MKKDYRAEVSQNFRGSIMIEFWFQNIVLENNEVFKVKMSDCATATYIMEIIFSFPQPKHLK